MFFYNVTPDVNYKLVLMNFTEILKIAVITDVSYNRNVISKYVRKDANIT
nr:hypothetical protein SUGSMm_10270 [Morganella morganii subsp. sibonii]